MATARAATAGLCEGRGETCAAGFARALVDLAVAGGADRPALLNAAGIEAVDLEDPDRRIPFERYKALMRAAKALTGDEAFALHFGDAFDITELSIVGLMGQACDTVAEAFALLPRFTRLAIEVELEEAAEGQRCVLRNVDGQLWLVDMRKNPNDFPELSESSFARMRTSGRRLGGDSVWKEVHFTHAAPPYADEYARIFGVPVVFESRWNAVRLSGDEWMKVKAPLPSPYVFAILKERAEALLQALDAGATMRGKVEALLAPVLHQGGATLPATAAKLGLSRATLARRLRAEGANFATVLDGLRRRLAEEYLARRRLSVSETAYLLGFSEPAAFSRAYRRWTGRTPRSVRAAAAAARQ
ncbi:MAG: AraC family transcriptional regulator [Alphaproteobacteria bacterium]|nr:AraC family transcriptional regulator [Alphaproteobacteria bacterium]